MKSLRPWIQVGLLSAITAWCVSGSVHSDDARPPAVEKSRPSALSPDVTVKDSPTQDASSAEKPGGSLRPEPETALPTSSAMPPTGDSSTPAKPLVPMDIDSQFEIPLEVSPSSSNKVNSAVPTPQNGEVRGLFSKPAPSEPQLRDIETAEPSKSSVTSPVSVQVPELQLAAEPVDPLLKLIDEAIEVSGRRYLTPDGPRPHTPWQIIHGLLAFRQDYQLKMVDGRKISGLDWLASGVTYQGESLFQKTPYGGRAHPFIQAYWFEGHPTQFMAYLTMCRLPLSHQFKTATGETITVADIVNNAKMEVNRQEEMTWTLWALSHYLEPDSQWINKKGEPWSIEELVRMEVQNTIYDGPCGGTHSLFATAYARNSYLQTKRPLRGIWLEADQKIERFIAEARALQNSDGSFSVHFFKGSGYGNDFNQRITSSGHMIEWLMVALRQSRLSEPWIQNGIRCLAQDLITNRRMNAECGPLYHAVDGLQIYRERLQIAAKAAHRGTAQSPATVNGWKPASQGAWPQPKSPVNGGQVLKSSPATTDVQIQTEKTTVKNLPTPSLELVIPKRGQPMQAAEKLPKTERK